MKIGSVSRAAMLAAALAVASLAAVAPASAQSPPTYPAAPTISFTKATGSTANWHWGAVTTNTDGSAVSGTITYEVFESMGPAGAAFTPGLVTQSLADVHAVSTAGTLCGFVVAIEGGNFTAAVGSTPASITGGIASPPSNMACGAFQSTPSAPPGFAGS